ncbi:nucleotide exchange factor GrpE [Candidatus Adlerbacteria bacterium RIFOXYC1_FULL_48_26]|uniref:Protein GrpE n=1 Tax=Candidatus Adlerbacteria bacterium RIFOXYC1_FULL_48_26 TaxID=1797247 RepID=A0A1F4Y3K1_9BACT|nr:MAG: nucleotide exchange factor GrpE [Candidatus Adlerbacteria bacterium RIFOXYC1_FULL_48_26]OGC94390.1 MAG: nucleotide exchange factor GrpE [Candidatus Adlerbacteria bacterium RIFOXYB1_FULL_48_10]OGC95249.1 MAG: nucleotide exchange factor GrpE [Candidatus Adlerbacteria bacterium RIFOXYD1_FULL_48_8]
MLDGSDEEFIQEDEDQSPAAIKKLREKLATAIQEKQEYLDGWQRARADFVNFKKEEALLLADKEDRIKAEFVEALLPSLDSFEMALKHNPSDELALVEKQLISSLQKMGVERFGAEGEAYDHYKHEALAQQGDGETVRSVERSGYKVGERIIRPAQVII